MKSDAAPVSRAPLYAVVRDDLLRRISADEFGVGDWLPSESELQAEYGVSQTPVRRALLDLEKAGLISRHQGRGSVVRSQELTAFNSMGGLSAELRARGHEVSSTLLGDVTREVPPRQVQETLKIGPDERVYHLRRLFKLDGEPCIVLEHYLAPLVGDGIRNAMRHGESLYRYLASQNLAITQAVETITATTLSPPLSDELQLDPAAPALVRQRVGLIDDFSPIEQTTYWIRPELYPIRIRLSGGASI